MLKIKDLHITQYGLRNRPQLQGMIDFIKKGGCFDEQSLSKPGPLIQIITFEDGEQYIADGHHRIAAMILAGRKEVLDSEFRLSSWTYSQYTDINLDCGWVTPFDPRQELRIADYSEFKNQVNRISVFEVHQFIRNNKDMYVKLKNIDTIADLIMEFDLP